MKIKRSDVAELYGAINEALAEKDPKIKFDTQIRLIPNKHKLKPIYEEINEQEAAVQRELLDLRIEFADKKIDQNGNEVPVIELNRYVGLARGQKPDFDKRSDEVSDKMKAYLDEEVEFEPCYIKESDLPRTVRGLVTEQLQRLVEPKE